MATRESKRDAAPRRHVLDLYLAETGQVFNSTDPSPFQESLIILGWVALWRPMGIFLYDWWPVRAGAKLLDRLGEMDVRMLDAERRPRRRDEGVRRRPWASQGFDRGAPVAFSTL